MFCVQFHKGQYWHNITLNGSLKNDIKAILQNVEIPCCTTPRLIRNTYHVFFRRRKNTFDYQFPFHNVKKRCFNSYRNKVFILNSNYVQNLTRVY